MGDSKQMFSSKLWSELVCVPLSALSMGEFGTPYQFLINSLSILLSCLLQAPQWGFWKLFGGTKGLQYEQTKAHRNQNANS